MLTCTRLSKFKFTIRRAAACLARLYLVPRPLRPAVALFPEIRRSRELADFRDIPGA